VYRLPVGHHKNMRSTNLLERFNEEIRRRTYVVRVFPNAEACLRLVRALASEQHEEWQEGHRYMNMQLLIEQKKERPRSRACCRIGCTRPSFAPAPRADVFFGVSGRS